MTSKCTAFLTTDIDFYNVSVVPKLPSLRTATKVVAAVATLATAYAVYSTGSSAIADANTYVGGLSARELIDLAQKAKGTDNTLGALFQKCTGQAVAWTGQALTAGRNFVGI